MRGAQVFAHPALVPDYQRSVFVLVIVNHGAAAHRIVLCHRIVDCIASHASHSVTIIRAVETHHTVEQGAALHIDAPTLGLRLPRRVVGHAVHNHAVRESAAVEKDAAAVAGGSAEARHTRFQRAAGVHRSDTVGVIARQDGTERGIPPVADTAGIMPLVHVRARAADRIAAPDGHASRDHQLSFEHILSHHHIDVRRAASHGHRRTQGPFGRLPRRARTAVIRRGRRHEDLGVGMCAQQDKYQQYVSNLIQHSSLIIRREGSGRNRPFFFHLYYH